MPIRVLLAFATCCCAFSLQAAAEEPQTLSLAAAQPLHTGELVGTGRVVPRFAAMIGSRLSAHIAEWGTAENGAPLDTGMFVKAGQKLFTLDASTFKVRADAARAALASAEAALVNLKAPARKERLDVLRAMLAELDFRIKDRERDAARYSRLVGVDHTMPVKRLEEVQLDLEALKAQRAAAQARLDEALAGPMPTETAVLDARVKEAQAALDMAQLDLHDTAVSAPFDGVITRRMKSLGDYVSGAPFVEVLELTTADTLEAEVNLPEAYLGCIVPGQTQVLLQNPALKNSLLLPVSRVIPQINGQLGTFVFRVAIPASQGAGLVAGSFISASLRVGGTVGGVVVPQRAVFTENSKSFVMVAEGPKMVRRAVEPGNRLSEGMVLKTGVRAGEKVVLGLAVPPKDEAPLPARLIEQPQ